MRAFYLVFALSLLVTTMVRAAEEKPVPGVLNSLLTALVVEIVPPEYEDRRKWGMQKKVFDGLKWSGSGLDIKVRNREKKVNDGTWKYYRITVVEPEKNLQVAISNFRKGENGRAAFDAVVKAKLHCFARLSQWESGIQLASFSVDADARAELHIQCELGIKIDSSTLPPGVVLEPVVTGANLDLASFKLRSISKLDGPLVHELGESLEDRVAKELDERSDKLVSKLNRSIAKNQDKLKLSLSDYLASQWDNLRDQSTADEKKAVDEAKKADDAASKKAADN